MRSYLPAFAKTARVHRYCAALNGGTRCAVSAAYRVGWCCPSFLDSGTTAVVGLGPHRVEHTFFQCSPALRSDLDFGFNLF